MKIILDVFERLSMIISIDVCDQVLPCLDVFFYFEKTRKKSFPETIDIDWVWSFNLLSLSFCGSIVVCTGDHWLESINGVIIPELKNKR